LQGVKEMERKQQEQRPEIKNEGKENRIQIIFFDTKKKDWKKEMKKWERLFHDTDYLDKDYLVVRRIDESKFR
jgi:hypothetical protein